MQPQDSNLPTEQQQPNNDSQWTFSGGDQQAQQFPQMQQEQPEVATNDQEATVQWTASEFIYYHKSFFWYVAVFTVSILFAVALYFFNNQDIVSIVVVIAMAILFSIYASRKPRVLNYRVDTDGVHIGNKLYNYNNFKSFAVIQEASLRSISLVPLQRFMPSVSMYYDPQEEQKIIEALSQFLPFEEKEQDLVDKLMHKIRF